jgi:hypothetical protein
MPQRSVVRIIQVTVGLSVLGTVVGGILGAGLVALVGVRIGDFRISGEVLYTGTVFGALMGCVLAPLAAWTLMRRVPIRRAIAETAIGTVAGTVIGLTFQPLRDTAWLSPPLLGVGGFALAAIRLRLSRRARRSEITPRAG